MIKNLVNFFSSLKLTVVCLAVACVVIFIGTLAQVRIGIYEAQKEYFQSFFIWWSPAAANWKLPVFPGGYLLGAILLVNLIAAHARRFKFTRKKIGIFLIHFGLILLLLGQLFTDILQVESAMRLTEGHAKNYSESARYNELVFVDVTDPDFDEVVSIPDKRLDDGAEIRHDSLPFLVRVKSYLPNSEPALARLDSPTEVTHGVGQRMRFQGLPVTYEMNRRNIPAVVIEIATENESLGVWAVSNWVGEDQLLDLLRQEWGRQLGELLSQPQSFEHKGRTYQLAMRPIRYYKPFYIHLAKFTHERYKGTEIPKNFASDVRILHPETGEDREAYIYMNNPLRYWGETYYQGSFDPNDPRISILHVVRNPAWLTPYLSCTIMGVGLTVQFGMHLFGFIRKRRGA